MIGFYHLLKSLGFPEGKNLKAYRHADNINDDLKDVSRKKGKVSIEDIRARGDILAYQSGQRSRNLGQIGDAVAFFVGERGNTGRFIGLFDVIDIGGHDYKSENAGRARDLGFLNLNPTNIWYELNERAEFNFLIDRAIIKWPSKGIHTSYWLGQDTRTRPDAEVLEIRAAGYKETFPRFDRLVISLAKLQQVARPNSSMSSWIEPLRTTRGVYLISDLDYGDLYIGSAVGGDGIWGRWESYAKTTHGGNKIMRLAVGAGKLKPDSVQFSILETLSSLSSEEDGLTAERLWKKKLGKKAITLNANY